MPVLTWSALIGTIAALCTTLAFVPQLLRVRRHGGRDLSLTMLTVYVTGMSLWLVYGIINDAGAVIVANVASIGLVSLVAVAKVSADRRSAGARRPRIAIDMDEVMADALGEHVRRYCTAFGVSLSIDELHGRHLEDYVPPEHRDAVEAMLDAAFFADLAVLPECREVVAELAERYDIFIVTAAMDVPCSFDAKYQWLRRHFPSIPPSNIVFCGDKGIVDADYLIDDRARHFARFTGQPLLFAAPHNAHETRYPRVSSWSDVRDAFARIDGASTAATGTRLPAVKKQRRAARPKAVARSA
jgi:5'(3')-deoxyribonucleotidase/uncharacterized protein with PQ loop repeat